MKDEQKEDLNNIIETIDIVNVEEYDENDETKSFIIEADKGVTITGDKGNAFVKIDVTNIIEVPANINFIDSFYSFISTISFSKAIFKTRFALEKFKTLKLYVIAEVPIDSLDPTVQKALRVKDIVIFQKGKPMSEEEREKKIMSTFNLPEKEA